MAKGLVDEDPGSAQPKYIDGLVEEFRKHDIRLMNDPGRKNKLIMLCPRLEEWLLETAKRAAVDMRESGLEADPRYLHEILGDRPNAVRKLTDSLLAKKSERLSLLGQLVSA